MLFLITYKIIKALNIQCTKCSRVKEYLHTYIYAYTYTLYIYVCRKGPLHQLNVRVVTYVKNFTSTLSKSDLKDISL